METEDYWHLVTCLRLRKEAKLRFEAKLFEAKLILNSLSWKKKKNPLTFFHLT